MTDVISHSVLEAGITSTPVLDYGMSVFRQLAGYLRRNVRRWCGVKPRVAIAARCAAVG